MTNTTTMTTVQFDAPAMTHARCQLLDWLLLLHPPYMWTPGKKKVKWHLRIIIKKVLTSWTPWKCSRSNCRPELEHCWPLFLEFPVVPIALTICLTIPLFTSLLLSSWINTCVFLLLWLSFHMLCLVPSIDSPVPCYSKPGPGASSNSITWDLVKNAEFQIVP